MLYTPYWNEIFLDVSSSFLWTGRRMLYKWDWIINTCLWSPLSASDTNQAACRKEEETCLGSWIPPSRFRQGTVDLQLLQSSCCIGGGLFLPPYCLHEATDSVRGLCCCLSCFAATQALCLCAQLSNTPMTAFPGVLPSLGGRTCGPAQAESPDKS